MKKWILASLLFALLGALAPVSRAALIIVEDPHWWPGPTPPHPMPPHPPTAWPPPHFIFAPLEVSYVNVKSRIKDRVAVTTVDQEFYNPNSARLEGTFLFPIPKGAHLDKFTMDIDGKQVEAELLPAEKARRIYEDIVRKMKDPALLEYSGRDVFKVRIFPIEPNSRKHITLSYTELLKSDNDLVSYELPLSTEKFSAKPIKNVTVRIELESKNPLKAIYSPSHRVEVKRDGPNRAVAVYEASNVQPDADFSLYFAPEKDGVGVNLLTFRPSGEDGYFLLLASPGLDTKDKRTIPKDVAFVLDTSGSMAGEKLQQAKKALKFCVENLNDNDRFEIIRFSTEVEPLFNKLVDANSQNRTRANEFIRDLKPIGGTAIDDALQQALNLREGRFDDSKSDSHTSQDRPFVVIFLTDGMPTIGTTDEETILSNVKKRGQGRTRIFSFGIGTDVNTHLLDRIAEDTRAVSQYVLPEEDIEVKVSNFFAKIKEPALANPTLQFTGDIRATKLYPSPLPDLFKGEQLVLVGRYSGHGSSAMVLEGSVNGTTRKFTYEGNFPSESTENEFIPRLWATRRVGHLMDEIRLHGENSELRDEVTELARKYSIVTPYTAYLIMEDETRRSVPAPMQTFRQLWDDKAAYSAAGEAFSKFKTESSGDSAVVDALAGSALTHAENAPAGNTLNLEQNAAFRRRYGLAGGAPAASGRVNSSLATAAPPAAERVTQYTQQSQFVNGKSFYQNSNQWLDAAVAKNQDAKKVRIQFASAEYFDLLAKNAKAAQWLALGQNVQFVMDHTIYDIYE
jgi:Ca-activated chloride channel family protein